MKVSIIVAMTADGYIGRHGDDLSTTWTNKEDKYLFTKYIKAANNMVMGISTFMTTAQKFPSVFNKTMPGRRLFVYTHHPDVVAKYENVEAVSESPQDFVARLEKEGVRELAVCGGAQIYTLFMQAGVVDDIYVDVQATLFGTGVPLFTAPLRNQITLEKTERIGNNNLLLHYKVHRA